MAQYGATLDGLPIPKRSIDPVIKKAGLIYFNTTINAYKFFDGDTWNVLSNNEELIIAVSDETTNISVGTNKFTFRLPYGYKLLNIRGSLNTAPTGSDLIVDINKNGTSILSTKLSININEKTSITASTPVVISDTIFIDNDEITIDIDQVGSTIPGAGLKIILYVVKN